MAIGAFLHSAAKTVRDFFSRSDEQPKADDRSTYSVLNLHKSKSAQDLLTAHMNVMTWYLPYRSQEERFYDFMRPDTMWDAEEKEALRRKGKPVVAFNRLKSSERAFIGNMLLQKYEIKAAPAEPSDQNLADVVSVLYAKAIHDNAVRYKDVSLLRDAWVSGNAWQEIHVEIGEGRKPRLVFTNQNRFAIYPDPDRRDLITNEDCKFIDRKGFYSMDDLITVYPEKEEALREALNAPNSITYEQQAKPWADRQHESLQEKNGRYACVERFYKVWRRRYDSVQLQDTPEAKAGAKATVDYDMTPDARSAWERANPDKKLCMEPEEWLYLAVACYGVTEYLYNGPYHCQPRNPKTGRIMFPLLELIDEDVGGTPTGHVEHMMGPNKAINSMAVNTVWQAKMAGTNSLVGDPEAFDEATQRDIEKNVADAPRVFWKKKGGKVPPGTGLSPVTLGSTGPDISRTLSFAEGVLEDNSSTPPAMKGLAEGNVPAALNEQRLQQAGAQSMVAVSNYQNFLMQRAILCACYWAEYWDFEEVVRVVEKSDPNGPDFITINELVADAWGNPYRRNNLKELLKYDITFEESWQSPSMRERTRRDIRAIMETPAVQGDPVLLSFLTYYALLLTDAPQDFKDFFREHSQVLQQRQEAKVAAEEVDMGLDQTLKMQHVADREAAAMAPPPPPAPRGVPRVPAGALIGG